MALPTPKRPAARYNPSREKRRIVWAVLTLAIVLIGISEARKPENWTWIAPPKSPAGAERQPALLAEKDDLEPDQVRIVASRPIPQGSSRSRQDPDDLDLRIEGDLLDQIEDARVGVRSSETPAYFAMLSKVRSVASERLARSARRDLTFAALMNDPAEHRGEIVWIEGELRRLTPIPAGPNDAEFDQLYEGWLFTDEAGRTNPYRVVCTTLPADFPTGDDVRERVQIAAYFFKRYTYATAHGQHAAPMFVGREFSRTPRSASATAPSRLASWLIPGTVGLAGLFGVLLYFLRRNEASPVPRGPQTISGDARLTVMGTPPEDPRDFLGRLQREGDASVPHEPPR